MNSEFVFDLHCDTLTTAEKDGKGLVNKDLHVSLDRLPKGLRLCQCTAVFIPDTLRGKAAQDYFETIHAFYRRELTGHADLACPVDDTGCVPELLQQKPFALMLTVEGGAVLGGDLDYLKHLCHCGVKMITLTWNGANELAGGASTDEGFAPFGRAAVREMERLGIVADVSHLSDAAFWELCGFAVRPFVASHSNARAVANHRRNLTDTMFREIAKRGGLVGLNYYKDFLSEDGVHADVNDLLRHAHHFLELGGEDVLALGSDYDGAEIPVDIAGVERIAFIRDSLARSGLSDSVVQKLMFSNANRFFAQYQEETRRRSR